MSKPIDVCCAIIIQNSELLFCQRGRVAANALKWELPGGKIEPNETAERCIIREIMEELNIEIKPIVICESIIHSYPNIQIRLIPFICEIIQGEIQTIEHDQIEWLSFDQALLLDLADADRELLLTNQNQIQRLLI